MNIYEKIKEERERLGFDQAGFAALGAASRHSQIDWEKGKSFPNAAVLSAWAAAGADVNYILTGVRVRDVEPVDRDLELIIGLVKGMDKKQKALAVELILSEEQGGVASKSRKIG